MGSAADYYEQAPTRDDSRCISGKMARAEKFPSPRRRPSLRSPKKQSASRPPAPPMRRPRRRRAEIIAAAKPGAARTGRRARRHARQYGYAASRARGDATRAPTMPPRAMAAVISDYARAGLTMPRAQCSLQRPAWPLRHEKCAPLHFSCRAH